MTKVVNIRNMPNDVHRILKKRADKAGLSLPAYVLAELKRISARPTMEELQDRLRRREPVILPVSAPELVRKMRDALELEESEKGSAARRPTRRTQKNRGRREV